jgi:uncharacterized protein (DUF2461 family)
LKNAIAINGRDAFSVIAFLYLHHLHFHKMKVWLLATKKNLAVTKIMDGLDYITLFDADKAAIPIGKKTIPIRVNAEMT